MVLNSKGTPPAAFTAAQARRPRDWRCTWPGMISTKLFATPTKGLSKSASPSPTALSSARCGALSQPFLTRSLRIVPRPSSTTGPRRARRTKPIEPLVQAANVVSVRAPRRRPAPSGARPERPRRLPGYEYEYEYEGHVRTGAERGEEGRGARDATCHRGRVCTGPQEAASGAVATTVHETDGRRSRREARGPLSRTRKSRATTPEASLPGVARGQSTVERLSGCYAASLE